MATQVEIEDQESFTSLDDGEIINHVSDNADSGPFGDSTILVHEGSFEHDVIKNCFLTGMGPFTKDTTIVSVRKNSAEKTTTRAKIAAFRVFAEATKRKNNGDANLKHGWYSGSKDEIDRIVSYGFSNREIQKFENAVGYHGVGIHIAHHRFSIDAALAGAAQEEEEIKHILLCRVILGKPELIVAGSNQAYPSSNEFDSGVDNIENPREYVIWSSTMNTHILPTYIVTFKSPRIRAHRGITKSPCVSFSVIFPILSKSLDPTRLNLILTAYDDFRKGKLRRDQTIKKLREVVGDHLLSKILRDALKNR